MNMGRRLFPKAINISISEDVLQFLFCKYPLSQDGYQLKFRCAFMQAVTSKVGVNIFSKWWIISYWNQTLDAEFLFPPPLVQANLPLLQRELLHCARAAKQTPAQYLSQHEHLLLSTTMASPPDSSELLMETGDAAAKRRSPSRLEQHRNMVFTQRTQLLSVHMHSHIAEYQAVLSPFGWTWVSFG